MSLRFFPFVVLVFIAVSCSPSSSDKSPDEVNSQGVSNADSAHKSAQNRKSVDGIDTTVFHVTDSTVSLRSGGHPQPSGRVISIAVTGLDSRLGDPMGHADANHIMRFFIDSGCVEIISIPRDTYFDAGFEDSTGLNKLTNVRANRGRAAYHKALMEIASIPKLDYWVEFGFSQAIGLLELIGYKSNASSTLRVLRSRQAYAAGDFQRVYNQGHFIRQVLLRVFDKTDDFVGELAIRASLILCETNLTYDACESLFTGLRSGGFTIDEPGRIWVQLRPSMVARLKVYSFDSVNVGEIDKQISHKIRTLGLDSIPINQNTYEKRLANLIDRAASDSAKQSGSVIRLLRRPFEQRAWLQITNLEKRRMYRDRMCGLLRAAYTRTKNTGAISRIDEYLEIDNKVSASR